MEIGAMRARDRSIFNHHHFGVFRAHGKIVGSLQRAAWRTPRFAASRWATSAQSQSCGNDGELGCKTKSAVWYRHLVTPFAPASYGEEAALSSEEPLSGKVIT